MRPPSPPQDASIGSLSPLTGASAFCPPHLSPGETPSLGASSFPLPPLARLHLPSMPWDIRSEAAKEGIIAFGIVLVLMVVAVLFALTFFGMEFIENAVG